MEQFNLEDYLKDPTREVVTREGYNVRILCTDLNKNDCPIVGCIQYPSGIEEVGTFQANGRCSEKYQSDTDLFFAPPKKSRWVFLYTYGGTEIYASRPFETREGAEMLIKARNVGGMKICVKAISEITWEE